MVFAKKSTIMYCVILMEVTVVSELNLVLNYAQIVSVYMEVSTTLKLFEFWIIDQWFFSWSSLIEQVLFEPGFFQNWEWDLWFWGQVCSLLWWCWRLWWYTWWCRKQFNNVVKCHKNWLKIRFSSPIECFFQGLYKIQILF